VRRRYYLITAKGQEALVDRLSEWQRFTNAMDSIMRPGASPEAQ
jgi:DNA-binding PadR family transcriptional regulator